MKKILFTFSILFILLGCQKNQYSFNNKSFNWDGKNFGLWPDYSNIICENIINQGKKSNPTLINALASDEHFATAHVLLTVINLKECSISGGAWNSLKVTLFANGDICYHPEQKKAIIKYWK